MRIVPLFAVISPLVLVAALLLPTVATAAAPYSVSTRSQAYQPIPIAHPEAQAPVTHLQTSSSLWVPLTLPFDIRFFDEDKRDIWITSNGFLRFSASTNWQYSNTPMGRPNAPQTGDPNGLIATWWDDTDMRNGGHVKVQYLGNPAHTVVIEWKNGIYFNGTNWANSQVWLFAGSSTIEMHYGTLGSESWTASMGIENMTGTDGYYIPSAGTGLDCGSSCGNSNWNTNTVVTFSQGPELRLTEVRGEPESFAGVRMPVSAKVTNVGGKPANDFTVRFWVSRTPSLTDQSRELLTLDGDTRSLQTQETTVFEANPRMPIDLEEGTYYIVAEADPYRAVPETSRGDNVAAYGPFQIGIRAANLAVSFVELGADLVAPGGNIEVSWLTDNLGNLSADKIPYQISIGEKPVVSPSSVVIANGTIDKIEMLEAIRWSHVVEIPENLPPGRYYVGVSMDPHRQIFEHDRKDNVQTSEALMVGEGSLLIVSTELPAAHAHGHYSARLDAAGGDGVLRWSIGPDSSLPPGLSLVEEASGSGYSATFLRGVPSATGSYEFTLVAQSGSAVAQQRMALEIDRATYGISISNENLAFAAFGFRYEERLAAFGGVPPYTWETTKGDLPMGVMLRSDGFLSGTPQQDGRFLLTVKVSDSEGRVGTRDLSLEVSAPSVLTCVTRELPPLPLGERVRESLIAAGGEKSAGGAYTWTSVATYRLATRIGEKPEEFPHAAPPGFELKGGSVQGIPTAIGTYLWKLKLEDHGRNSQDCHVLVQVPEDRGLAVVTKGLPTAFAGRSYQVRLEAAGGDGNLTWSEYGGGRVLEDLGLKFDLSGLLVGTPAAEFLDGESQKDFSVMVSVTDEANRVGVGALTLRLHARPPTVEKKAEEEGCQTASGDTGFLALALLGLVMLRRRGER